MPDLKETEGGFNTYIYKEHKDNWEITQRFYIYTCLNTVVFTGNYTLPTIRN